MAHKAQHAPNETELEMMAQAELSRLKRQYRIMENDRIACVEDAKLQLRNQLNMIDRLEYEKAELLLRIKTASSKTFIRQDKEMEEKLKCLLETQEKYENMIETEKQEITELDDHIRKVRRDFDRRPKISANCFLFAVNEGGRVLEIEGSNGYSTEGDVSATRQSDFDVGESFGSGDEKIQRCDHSKRETTRRDRSFVNRKDAVHDALEQTYQSAEYREANYQRFGGTSHHRV